MFCVFMLMVWRIWQYTTGIPFIYFALAIIIGKVHIFTMDLVPFCRVQTTIVYDNVIKVDQFEEMEYFNA